MAIINKSTNNNLARIWRKGNPSPLLVGMQTGAATVESSMEIPEKIKNGSAFWISGPSSGNISEGTQNTNWKEHKHYYVLCIIIYSGQDLEAAQEFISRWVGKITTEHLKYNIGILLSFEKEEHFTLCDSMDGPGEHYGPSIMNAKWNKPVRERPYDFTHTWNLMNKLN